MKKVVIVVLTLVIVTFGGMVIKMIFFPVNAVSRSVDMAYDIMDKTLDGDNAIYNYEWFKQQEADIRKCVKNENIAQEEYDMYLNSLPADSGDWSKFQEQEEASLRNSVSALKKLTNTAMEDYNARAEMANRNIFNDNLPSNISRAFYAGMELIK